MLEKAGGIETIVVKVSGNSDGFRYSIKPIEPKYLSVMGKIEANSFCAFPFLRVGIRAVRGVVMASKIKLSFHLSANRW